MKIIGKILVVLALCFAGSASAQTAGGVACVPYTIPIDSTITSCGPGLIGSKYKTTTKVCPSGEVTQSTDYDTSKCIAAPPPPATVNTSSRCKLMPDSCAIAPVAQNCPSGAHWTLLGSAIAHCVLDDPTCPWGNSLKHDSLGNPSCVANTCPSNQVLQSDGVSCACSSGLVWNGSSCVVQTPTCNAGQTYAFSGTCVAGDFSSGNVYNVTTTTCPSGPYGPPSTSTSRDTSACAPPPPTVTCTPSSYSNSSACSSGSGTQYQTVSISCPGGSYGSPSTSYGPWDTSGCSAPPPSGGSPGPTCTTSTSATACGAGYTGTKYITTSNNCPSGTTTSTDTSGCGCANGGSDYPTCTPPYTPPPVPRNICAQDGKSYDVCTASGPLPSKGQHQSITYYDDGTNTGTCTKTITRLGNCGYNPSYWYIDF